jgi:hypothetical protein
MQPLRLHLLEVETIHPSAIIINALESTFKDIPGVIGQADLRPIIEDQVLGKVCQVTTG